MGEGLLSNTHSPNENLRLPQPELAEISFSTAQSRIRVLSDERAFEATGTRVAFTTRHGGISQSPFLGLNLSYSVGDERETVDTNRAMLCEALGAKGSTGKIVSPSQVHGIEILDIENDSSALRHSQDEADGIVCTALDVPVLLCFADCVPVIILAPDGCFAVLHSGWRGAIGSIAGLGLTRLSSVTGYPANQMNCYVGPHIGSCCYEVSGELIDDFAAKFGDSCDAGSNHLDLTQAVRASLLHAGADASRILDADCCTSCNHDAYYSYRAENGLTGRHGAFAMRKEEL